MENIIGQSHDLAKMKENEKVSIIIQSTRVNMNYLEGIDSHTNGKASQRSESRAQKEWLLCSSGLFKIGIVYSLDYA